MGSPKQSSTIDFEILEQMAALEARQSFHKFRRYMNPNMKRGWWQEDAANNLVQWFYDLKSGKRPILIIEAPPQHGKSKLIVDFTAWLCGKDPKLAMIYASVSKRLGTRANLSLQRMFDSSKYKRIFPKTRITPKVPEQGMEKKTRSQELLEFLGHDMGSFRNVTVNGSIVGEGLDVGIIDDPIKGRDQANSLTIREKSWSWLNDDFMTRFSEYAGLIGILTRWHLDDPIGRLIAANPHVKVLRYPALSTAEAKLMPHDPRPPGSDLPLFPEHKSKEFLLARKKIMSAGSWSSLYQQDPFIQGGEIFKAIWWRYWETLPVLKYRIIYGDTAQKDKEQNDYSVFQCWGVSKEGMMYLLDQIRGKWEAPELEVQARAFWNKHKAMVGPAIGHLRSMKIEDKVSGTGLIQSMRRASKKGSIPILGIERSRDKVERANDVTPSIQAGLVWLPADAEWLADYLLEFAQFPNGTHDDQVDPTIDAIADNIRGGYTLDNV